MACCGLDDPDNPRPVIVTLALASVVVTGTGLASIGLVALSPFSKGARLWLKMTFGLMRSTVRAVWDGVRERSLSPKLRCRLSGLLWPVSSSLAGFVYRRFNTVLLLSAGALTGVVLVVLRWLA